MGGFVLFCFPPSFFFFFVSVSLFRRCMTFESIAGILDPALFFLSVSDFENG